LARVAVLVTSLLVSTTILCATLARRWLARSDQGAARATVLRMPAAQPMHSAARQELEPELRPAPADSTVNAPLAMDEGVVASASATRVSSHRERPRDSLAGRRQAGAFSDLQGSAEASPPPQVAPAPPPEEAALVMAALRSLRREHNPAQAGALLQTYLTRFPQGVLTEEALAIAIEAAVARHDVSSATALAKQYVGRYPAGRFVGLARKIASARP
jgi:TolA-binding protein